MGIFENNEPSLTFSVERVELSIIEGKDTTGEFFIRSGKGKKIRGIVYSTNPRMECLTPQFEGEEIRIRYCFHSEGLLEGDIRKGEFVVVCEQGEFNLSFVVSVSRLYAMSSAGKIKNLSDFCNLAKENFEESYHLFYSSGFSNLFHKEDQKEALLYEIFKKEAPSKQAVEAYLVGVGLKEQVHVYVDDTEQVLYEVNENKKEQITLVKNGWGYVSCQVSCDASFVKLSKTVVTTEDFLGNRLFYEYEILENALHAGWNYAKLCFRFENKACFVVLRVTKHAKEEEKPISFLHENKECKVKLTKCYIDFRLKKIVTGVWAKESILVLNHLLEFEPENEFYQLMKAQAYLINRQRQEASWILAEFKRTCTNRESIIWGYYLYLTTLMEREEVYVNRVAKQLEELYHIHSQNEILFWILLFVREDYVNNNSLRLKAIEKMVTRGANSPFFYMEALYLLLQDPYLLTKLGEFELKILNWARKQEAISKELAMQVLHLANNEKKYSHQLFRIIKACYQVADSQEALAVVCAYLLKGQKFTEEYHVWYERGVLCDLRITNLYEAYLLSANENSMKQIPKVVYLYFQYHNNLAYKQLALLYAHIIKSKEEQKDIYLRYRRTMEQFAMEQIEAGHIDTNLAVIYREMLPLGILNHELAEKLERVFFTHHLRVKNQVEYIRAMVICEQFNEIQTVPIVNGEAYFSAYTNDYCILLLDKFGNFCARNESFEEENLLNINEVFEQAYSLAKECIHYMVYAFDWKWKKNRFQIEDEQVIEKMLGRKEISENWMTDVAMSFLRQVASFDLIKQVNYKRLSPENRSYLIHQLIESHSFELAYEILESYGYDSIDHTDRVVICSYGIKNHDFGENDFLLGLADTTFLAGTYNDVILIFLCKFYKGPTKHMAQIWKAAGEFEIDTYDLEERIITQMLYSTDYIDNMDQIYESYCKGGGNELICNAYLSYFSHLYLSRDAFVSSDIFEQIEYKRLMHQEMNDTLCLALLKFYGNKEKLTEIQYRIADELLLDYTCKGIYFSFYKDLDQRLVQKYHFNDKFFVEYHTKPGTLVTISYQINGGNYQTTEVQEVYDGIFVKPFILFFGDLLDYYITETNETYGQNISVSGQLENQDVFDKTDQSRYALINDIYMQMALQEEKTLQRELKEYYGKIISTEEIFKILS